MKETARYFRLIYNRLKVMTPALPLNPDGSSAAFTHRPPGGG